MWGQFGILYMTIMPNWQSFKPHHYYRITTEKLSTEVNREEQPLLPPIGSVVKLKESESERFPKCVNKPLRVVSHHFQESNKTWFIHTINDDGDDKPIQIHYLDF